ncbi:MAG TPA: C40 family peptidase [Mycobacteriales bacterium]|nr:C40 family peptidase [Mycobacteriales bacterium]
MPRFISPRPAFEGARDAWLRHAPGWLPRRTTAGGLVLVLLAVLTVGTGATAVTAALLTNHHTPVADTPLAAAPPGSLGQLIAPGAKPPPAPPRHHRHLVSATLLVSDKQPLTFRQLSRLQKLSGVRRVQTVMAGHERVEGHNAFVLGVDPATFRSWTPKLTADSNPLWQTVEDGELATSFDMGENTNLPLGGTVPVGNRHGSAAMRIGAFASVGMAGVDAVMSTARAAQLGLSADTGALISAPKADPLKLRRAAIELLGHGVHVELLREVIVTRDAGEFLTRLQIYNFLKAAESRIGLPYVWGAAGPSSFDCSGLVQWAFAQAGIAMPRVSEEQFFTGPHVPYEDARPGDLLFWHYNKSDPTDVDHVAIYAGNGMMVVAPHTGEYVEYVPVPLNDMAGVVRVDPSLAAELA